jgi:hypothetical protein
MRPFDAYPRHALVMWPTPFDPTLPSCIYLSSVDDAVARGAVVIAREWEPVIVTAQGDGEDD